MIKLLNKIVVGLSVCLFFLGCQEQEISEPIIERPLSSEENAVQTATRSSVPTNYNPDYPTLVWIHQTSRFFNQNNPFITLTAEVWNGTGNDTFLWEEIDDDFNPVGLPLSQSQSFNIYPDSLSPCSKRRIRVKINGDKNVFDYTYLLVENGYLNINCCRSSMESCEPAVWIGEQGAPVSSGTTNYQTYETGQNNFIAETNAINGDIEWRLRFFVNGLNNDWSPWVSLSNVDEIYEMQVQKCNSNVFWQYEVRAYYGMDLYVSNNYYTRPICECTLDAVYINTPTCFYDNGHIHNFDLTIIGGAPPYNIEWRYMPDDSSNWYPEASSEGWLQQGVNFPNTSTPNWDAQMKFITDQTQSIRLQVRVTDDYGCVQKTETILFRCQQ